MRKSLTMLIILSLGKTGLGVLISFPLENLVEESDLIVVGALANVCEFSQWTTDYGRGIITVEEALWGKVKLGERLVLEWRNPRAARYRYSRTDHAEIQNQRVIWLLTLDGTGYVRADWRVRVRGLGERSEILEILAKLQTAEPKEYVAVAPPEELLAPPNRLLCLTVGEIVLIIVGAVVAWWLLSITRSVKRQLSKKVPA